MPAILKPRVLGLCTDWGRPGSDGKYGAVSWYRIINPLEKLGADVQKGAFFFGGAQTALEMQGRGDIWMVKPIDSPEAVLELFANRDFTGAKLVLDLDDDPFNINEKHPEYQKHKDKGPLLKMFIERADHVVCSTDEIKKVVQDINPHITVIPNAIDPAIWKMQNKRHKDGKIRIGWIGSGSHMADIDIIIEPMKEILRKYPQVEFHMAGMVYEKSQTDNVYHHEPTKGYEEYPQYVADMGFDIAIAPLHDTQFNRCKSNIKWLEHAMLETPMVLSRVTPYKECVKHGKTGLLAKNTKANWVKQLSVLIEDETLRQKIGQAAKAEVLESYCINQQLPKYEQVFQRLKKKDITVYTSVVGNFDKLKSPQEDYTADYIAFVDSKQSAWETKPTYKLFKNDRRNSRIHKILPHLYFDTEYSIYVDGNIHLTVPAQQLVAEWLKDKDIAVFRHVGRDCLYEEVNECVRQKKGNILELAEQQKAYAKAGFPLHAGLAECGVIVRRNTPRIQQLCEKWWAHYCRYSERDQISFPFVFPMDEVNLIESSVWRHPYFEFEAHL